MIWLFLLIVLAVIALAIFVLTDSFTKLTIRRRNNQKARWYRKGKNYEEIVVPKLLTEEQRISNNIPAKKDVSVGDSAAEVIRREKVFKFIERFFSYSFLVIAGILVIIPFYWMFAVSLKTQAEIDLPDPTLFPGWGPEFPIAISNFPAAMERLNGVTLMANTIWVGIWSTIGTLVTTIMAAFAFTRIKFFGREILFTIFLSTMMIPGEMMVITNFITVSNIKMLNGDPMKGTFASLIIPFLISVYYIYLLRQNFKQIPDELYYAAKVDGTSDLKYLFKVMIPIATPTIITITILKMMGSWNAYAWPKIMAAGSKDNIQLITSGLRESFTDTEGRTSQGLQMAASTIVTLPLLFVFIFLRKYIMRGVSRSGIKG